MPHILILNEGWESGAPVWRFAAPRDEALYVYAPRQPSDREEQLSSAPDVWMRTFWKPWAAVDLRGYEDKPYAAYFPCSEKDVTRLCGGDPDGVLVVTPCELSEEHSKSFSLIESKVRPLKYLQQTDLCGELDVPWAYLLGIYFESSLSLFIAESESMTAALTEFTKQVEQCHVISPKDVAAWEKWDWLHHDQREEKLRITEEQKRNGWRKCDRSPVDFARK